MPPAAVSPVFSRAPIDWKIPIALLLVSTIPVAAGVARLHGLATGAGVTEESARFVQAPLAVVLHIVGASLFSVLGALQFSTGLRLRHPRWHRGAGRVAVSAGVVTALTGAWLTAYSPIPAAMQGGLLYSVRIVVAVGMLLAIGLAVTAVGQRDFFRHRAWMIRAYALAQGAGMQVVVLLPWMLLWGQPAALQRDVLMSLAWLVNLAIAESTIYWLRSQVLLPHKRTP